MEKVFAIVVLYQQNKDLLYSLLNALVIQVEKVVVVDNNLQKNIDILKNHKNIEYIFMGGNSGIAAAQNAGVKYAISCDADYLIFLDQDSSPTINFIRDLGYHYKKLAQKTKLAGIGPRLVDRFQSFDYFWVRFNSSWKRQRILPKGKQPMEASLLISSGMLVSTETFLDVGYFNEDLFIDYVDTEWCFRCLSRGYLFFGCPDVLMLHKIGIRHLNFFQWKIPVHSASRRYYRIRNSFYLLRMNHIPPSISKLEILKNIAHQIIIILCCSEKLANLRFLYRGIVDGITKKN